MVGVNSLCSLLCDVTNSLEEECLSKLLIQPFSKVCFYQQVQFAPLKFLPSEMAMSRRFCSKQWQCFLYEIQNLYLTLLHRLRREVNCSLLKSVLS